MKPPVIERWHQVVTSRDLASLDALLDTQVVFESPVVHSPQTGKAITQAYLTAALNVLNNRTFHYLGEWFGERSAVLEFETEIDGVRINGVDMIWWNAEERITRFKVMVRPLKAINLLHQLMARALQGGQQQ
jgi:hypothetical protein